jgi:hypothetical protein
MELSLSWFRTISFLATKLGDIPFTIHDPKINNTFLSQTPIYDKTDNKLRQLPPTSVAECTPCR